MGCSRARSRASFIVVFGINAVFPAKITPGCGGDQGLARRKTTSLGAHFHLATPISPSHPYTILYNLPCACMHSRSMPPPTSHLPSRMENYFFHITHGPRPCSATTTQTHIWPRTVDLPAPERASSDGSYTPAKTAILPRSRISKVSSILAIRGPPQASASGKPNRIPQCHLGIHPR